MNWCCSRPRHWARPGRYDVVHCGRPTRHAGRAHPHSVPAPSPRSPAFFSIGRASPWSTRSRRMTCGAKSSRSRTAHLAWWWPPCAWASASSWRRRFIEPATVRLRRLTQWRCLFGYAAAGVGTGPSNLRPSPQARAKVPRLQSAQRHPPGANVHPPCRASGRPRDRSVPARAAPAAGQSRCRAKRPHQ